MAALLVSCELDQYPHTETTSKDVYASAANYESVLSGIYTSMIVNLSSISGDDRFQNYTRALLMFQEATTDNMDNVWAAGESTTDLNNLAWTETHHVQREVQFRPSVLQVQVAYDGLASSHLGVS